MYFLTYSLILFSGLVHYLDRRVGVFFYIVSMGLIGLQLDSLLEVADLRWYRDTFEILDLDNLLLLVIQNDFEFLWFVLVIVGKYLIGDQNLSIGYVSFFIYASIFFSKKCRDQIPLFSAFMLYPGSFLLQANVLRQGYSEYFVMAYFFIDSYLIGLCAIFFHRFSLVLVVGKLLIQNLVNVRLIYFFQIVGIFLVICLRDYIDIGVYDQLSVSYYSLSAKFLIYSAPFLLLIIIFGLNSCELNFYFRFSIFVFLLAALFSVLHPRMGDRVVFYVLPFSLIAYFDMTKSRRSLQVFILLLSFFGSISTYFLDSYQEFFDSGIRVTEEIDHVK